MPPNTLLLQTQGPGEANQTLNMYISAKLEQRQNSFFQRTIRDWNSLPSNIRKETKLDSFKRNLNSIPDQPGPRSRRD